VIVIGFLLSAIPAMAAAQPAADFAGMVQTEYDFSAAATRTSQRAAFLEYVAEDGVLFRPGPVNGRKAVAQGKGAPGILHWYPEFAEISNRGGLGLSTGPWIYWGSGQAPAHGHFVSIWRRQPSGEWRAELDGGIGHAAMATPPARLPPSARDGTSSGAAVNQTDSTASLEQADLEFARSSDELGFVAALARVALPAVRVYRDGHEPFVGLEAAIAHLRADAPVGRMQPELVRSSGDFGYSYGPVTAPGAESKPVAYYVHVWKLIDGQWRLLLDLLIPMQ
jgi:ketosteroid isomerase-like protein